MGSPTARIRIDGATSFAVWAPNARRVTVRVRTGSAAGDHPARARRAQDVFAATIPGARAGDDYAFRIDGGTSAPIPARDGSRTASTARRASSIRTRSSGPTGWTGIEMADLVIYELHVGTFTPEGTFDAIIPRLAHAARARRHRHRARCRSPSSPAAQLGLRRRRTPTPRRTPTAARDGLQRLVDAAHAAGLAVILDVVYNHLGPEGNYLGEFGPYFTDKYKTPWGAAVNYDDRGCDAVRDFVLDNALHVAGRVPPRRPAPRRRPRHLTTSARAHPPAIKTSPTTSHDRRRAGRHVHLDRRERPERPARSLRRREQGGYGLTRSGATTSITPCTPLLTGERAGYYADFGEAQQLAEALETPFLYAGGITAPIAAASTAPRRRPLRATASSSASRTTTRSATAPRGDRLTR